MFCISNTLVGILNILTLFISLAGMCGSAYIHFHHADCLKVLLYPLLFGSVFIFVVSILGISGSLCHINPALYTYLLVTFFVILGFMLFTVFALFVTNKEVGDKFSGKGFGEYRVTDFSLWLQHYVIDDKNWEDIRRCLVDARVCHDLTVVVDDAGGDRRNNDSIVFKQFSTTQFGCCKPPVECGFTMKNATFWDVPKTGPASNDSDCNTWKNKENTLCYDCNTCKGGVLASIRHQWRYLTIFNVCVLVLLTSVYVLGCYAIRNNRAHYKHQYHRRRASHP